MVDFRKLAAVDIAYLGSRLILAEFSIGVFGSLALGLFALLRSRSLGGIALASYLLSIGVNYIPLLLYAISLVRLDSARYEIDEDTADKRRIFRKYRRQSLLLLVPLAVPILVLARELHQNTLSEQRIPLERQTLIRRHPVFAYFVITYAIAWLGASLVVMPALVKREAVSKVSGVLMFPAIRLGPSITGFVLTRIVDGKRVSTSCCCECVGFGFQCAGTPPC